MTILSAMILLFRRACEFGSLEGESEGSTVLKEGAGLALYLITVERPGSAEVLRSSLGLEKPYRGPNLNFRRGRGASARVKLQLVILGKLQYIEVIHFPCACMRDLDLDLKTPQMGRTKCQACHCTG